MKRDRRDPPKPGDTLRVTWDDVVFRVVVDEVTPTAIVTHGVQFPTQRQALMLNGSDWENVT